MLYEIHCWRVTIYQWSTWKDPLENKFPTNQKEMAIFLLLPSLSLSRSLSQYGISLSLEDRWLLEFQKHLSSIRFYRLVFFSIMGNLFASPR